MVDFTKSTITVFGNMQMPPNDQTQRADPEREAALRLGHPDYQSPPTSYGIGTVGQPYLDVCCLLRQLDRARGVRERF